MGSIASRKAGKIIEHTAQVLAIEWISACQAYEFLRPIRMGKGTNAAYELLRKYVPALKEDRILAPDMRIAKDLLWNDKLFSYVGQRVKLL